MTWWGGQELVQGEKIIFYLSFMISSIISICLPYHCVVVAV